MKFNPFSLAQWHQLRNETVVNHSVTPPPHCCPDLIILPEPAVRIFWISLIPLLQALVYIGLFCIYFHKKSALLFEQSLAAVFTENTIWFSLFLPPVLI